MSEDQKILRVWSLILALAFDVSVLGNAAAEMSPQADCYADWSSALPVVLREVLTPVRDLHIRAREQNVGDVVRVTLCTEHGRYVYRLLVREPTGHFIARIVDARKPF